MNASLIPTLREALSHLNSYSEKATNDAHKRRITRAAIKLEMLIAEMADTLEPI